MNDLFSNGQVPGDKPFLDDGDFGQALLATRNYIADSSERQRPRPVQAKCKSESAFFDQILLAQVVEKRGRVRAAERLVPEPYNPIMRVDTTAAAVGTVRYDNANGLRLEFERGELDCIVVDGSSKLRRQSN